MPMSDPEKPTDLRVIIAGGGTGGHLFPAIAIEEALANTALERPLRTVFVGTRRGLEAKVLPHLGKPVKYLWISGVAGQNPLRKALAIVQLVVSFLQSALLLATFRPHVVVGTGGYVSGPILFCAHVLGFPILLQEQNAFPGLTTRLLARFANRICVHFPETVRRLPHTQRVTVTGNPLRSSLTNLDREEARRFWKLDAERPVLLVLGGSLGARTINNAIAQSLSRLLEYATIIWQIGRAGLPDRVDVAFRNGAMASGRLVIREFIDEMPMAYGAATLALCRAGAVTLSELALARLPAILVPYPYAAHQHQDWNARAYETSGAAVRIPDAELTGDKVCEAVTELLSEPQRLEKMSAAMQTFAKPNAAADIARMIVELGGSS